VKIEEFVHYTDPEGYAWIIIEHNNGVTHAFTHEEERDTEVLE